MFNFTFNSRATYLAQVADWKATYAAHSAQIRSTRRAFRAAQQAYSLGTAGAWTETERLRRELACLRGEATALLAERHAAKEEAGRQWQAQRLAAA